MAIHIDFVTAPYPPQGGTKKSAASGFKMAMLFSYSGLTRKRLSGNNAYARGEDMKGGIGRKLVL